MGFSFLPYSTLQDAIEWGGVVIDLSSGCRLPGAGCSSIVLLSSRVFPCSVPTWCAAAFTSMLSMCLMISDFHATGASFLAKSSVLQLKVK